MMQVMIMVLGVTIRWQFWLFVFGIILGGVFAIESVAFKEGINSILEHLVMVRRFVTG